MPTALPESVREHLGEQVASDLSHWFDENLSQNVVLRDEYREVLSRLDVLENEVAGINDRLDRMDERLEGRFAQIDGRFNQMEDRFNQIDQRFEEQSAQFNQRIDEQSAQLHQRLDEQSAQFNERIDRLHEQMRVQTRWTVGTIALFGTIVTVLLAIAEFGA